MGLGMVRLAQGAWDVAGCGWGASPRLVLRLVGGSPYVVGIGRAVHEPPLRLPSVFRCPRLLAGGRVCLARQCPGTGSGDADVDRPPTLGGLAHPPPQDVPGWLTGRLIRLHLRLGLRPAKALGLRWLRSFWVSPGVRTWNGGDLFGTGSPGGTPKRQTDLLLPPLVPSQHQMRQDPYKTGGDRSGPVWSTPLLAGYHDSTGILGLSRGSFHHRGHGGHREEELWWKRGRGLSESGFAGLGIFSGLGH